MPTITDTSQQVRVSESLQKIDALNPELNAFITILADQALAVAHDPGPGPLHGIPIGIKDFYDTAGIRTTAAFKAFANRIPAKDAAAVAQLKRAGAIIIGTT